MQYISNNNFVISEVAGETVLVPLTDSIAQMDRIFVLSETGACILKFIEQPHSLSEIVENILNEFESTSDVVTPDAEEFLESVVKNGYAKII